jgi:hypothetical protein
MLIGYMHYRKSPVGLNRAYAFASVAKSEGAELLYFSPGSIREGSINGYIYNNGEWRQTDSRYPDVVYNTTGFSHDSQIKCRRKTAKQGAFYELFHWEQNDRV